MTQCRINEHGKNEHGKNEHGKNGHKMNGHAIKRRTLGIPVHYQDWRIGWRQLSREPAYSALVAGALALAFTACFLLLCYVHYCFSYDRSVPQHEQVYVMQHKVNLFASPAWIEFMPLPARASAQRSGMADAVSAAVPQEALFQAGGTRLRDEVTLVDPAFAAVFGLRALEGDLHAALTRPDGLALTASMARTLFGSAAGALHRTLRLDGRPYQVLALLPDPASNTTMPYRSLAGLDSALWTEKERSARLAAWQALGGKVYVRLKPGAGARTALALQTFLQEDFDRSSWSSIVSPAELKRMGHVAEVRLRALDQAYFDTDVAGAMYSGPRGDKPVVLALAGLALLMLGLAAANYVNLAALRTLRREREIAMRKVLGASAARVAAMLMAESLLVTLLSGGAGILMAWLLLPRFALLVERRLDGVFTPASIGAALLLAVLVGLASGAYPAWLALRMRAADALAGRGDSESRRALFLRRTLGVLQFGAAIALCGVTLAIGGQTAYATRGDPGFDPEPLAVLTLPRSASVAQRQAMHEALARLPGVDRVTFSDAPLGASGVMKSGGQVMDRNGRAQALKIPRVGAGYFQVLRVAPLHGRLFDPAIDSAARPDAVVLNMAAVGALGFSSPGDAIGQRIDAGRWTIVGVAPDLRDQNLREPVQATMYCIDTQYPAATLTVRSSLAPARLHALAEAPWMRYFPDTPFDLRSARSVYAASYADDIRLAAMLGTASLIALAIAAFGMYVLSAYSVQRRSREIVLRKLHGATPAAIARLVGGEFLLMIALAAALGLPLAAVGAQRYLAQFAQRAPLGAWPLLGALLFALVVGVIASARHTLAAMRVAPARALRN